MIEIIQQNIWYIESSLFYSLIFAVAFKNRKISNSAFLNFCVMTVFYLLVDGIFIVFSHQKELFITPIVTGFYLNYILFVIIAFRVVLRIFFHQRKYFSKK